MQKETLRLFWQASNRYKWQRFLSILFPFAAVSTNSILAPYVLSLFLNQLQTGTLTFENSLGLVVTYGVILIIGELFLWRFALYFCWTFETASQRDLYLKIFHKLSHESIDFHADRFGGSLVSQTTKFVGSFERFWDMIIWSITPMVTMTIGAIIVIASLGYWPYAMALTAFTLVFVGTVIVSSRFLATRNTVEAQTSTVTSGYLADMVTNIANVKSFGREKFEHSVASQKITTWHAASQRLKWGVLSATAAYAGLLVVLRVIALLFAIYAAIHGYAAIGVIYLILAYSLDVGRQLWEMNNITRTYNRVIGDAYDMTNILLSPTKLIDTSTKNLAVTAGSITFDAVSFAHNDSKHTTVFDNFSLTIPAGQKVGFVGHSGSGKTTLTRLLLRFSDLDHGSITIDSHNIASVTQESLHQSIAYVPQEPLLFHRSLAENIQYGKPDATADEIREAAKKAHAHEFIQTLPHQYETIVGERGVKLSGGQRQRIAIARAVLKDAPILVLDEATSALDSESEVYIQKALTELMKNRTSIVIAHRLSTISKLDRIIVLDNGAIIEDGTHAELLARDGVYAKLWAHQSGGFIEQ